MWKGSKTERYLSTETVHACGHRRDSDLVWASSGKRTVWGELSNPAPAVPGSGEQSFHPSSKGRFPRIRIGSSIDHGDLAIRIRYPQHYHGHRAVVLGRPPFATSGTKPAKPPQILGQGFHGALKVVPSGTGCATRTPPAKIFHTPKRAEKGGGEIKCGCEMGRLRGRDLPTQKMRKWGWGF